MQFPLDLLDITLWLAIIAIVLTITSEFISPQYGKINLVIERERLKKAALFFSALFLISVSLHIVLIIA